MTDKIMENMAKSYMHEIPEGYEARIEGNKVIIELAESEDERTRKEIVEFIRSQIEDGNSVGWDRWIAYLEKQKEHKPELVRHPPITYTYPSDASRDEQLKRAIIALLNSDLIKVAGNKFTKQDLIDWVEKQKEQKEIPLMNGDADLYFDTWRQEVPIPTFRQCFEEGMKYAQRLQKEPHYTKRNALFDKCVAECDPEIMQRVSDEIDEMLGKEQKPASTEDMPYITDEHFYEREPADSFKYKLAEYMTRGCTKKEGPYGYEYGISAETILEMAKEELLKRGIVQKPVKWRPQPESLEALMYAIEGKWDMIKPTSYLSRRLEDLYEGLVNTYNVDETHMKPKPNFDTHWENGSMVCEQKPVEWSEEDEERLYKIAEFLAYHGYKDDADFIDSIRDKREMNPPKINGNPIPTDTKSVDIQSHTWSEEDEENLGKLHRLLVICQGEKKFIPLDEYDKLDKWLKSLKPQPKQEWSKEDAPYFDDICEILLNHLHYGKNINKDAVQKDLGWFTSLRERIEPQPKQKWSEEEKQLLLKDLCARLPYGVRYKGDCGWPINPYQHTTSLCNILNAEEPLVYLRPMSSMTEEEKKEFQACHCVYDLHPDFQPMMCNIANEQNMFDWLNKKGFDYRGLIPMRLALEAPEDMYKTE